MKSKYPHVYIVIRASIQGKTDNYIWKQFLEEIERDKLHILEVIKGQHEPK